MRYSRKNTELEAGNSPEFSTEYSLELLWASGQSGWEEWSMAWVRETQDKTGLQRASPPPVLFHGREHRSCSSLLKVTDISATSSTARSRAEGSGPLPPPLLLRLTSPHLSLSLGIWRILLSHLSLSEVRKHRPNLSRVPELNDLYLPLDK